MTDRTGHVLAAIDGALEDWSVSCDAMRWQPDDGFPRGLMLGAAAPAWIAPEVWDDAAVPIPHLPAEPLVADPVGDIDRAEAERHQTVTWEHGTYDDDTGPFGPVRMSAGRSRVSCSCGWSASPPDPITGQPMWLTRAQAWRAWARHVPPALHAAAFAHRRWLDDHGRLFPPDGWDAPGGPYDWRSWGITITDTETGVTLTVRSP